MKINKCSELPVKIVIEAEILYFDIPGQTPIAASKHRGFQIPDGPLISGIPGAIIDSQAVADYEAFIESVTDLITEYYELIIYYKNKSKDYSNYFGMLAKDSRGNIIADFDFTLRVSNHDPHRSKESQRHKKQRQAELKRITEGKKPRPITDYIVVNDTEFDNYLDAYLAVDKMIEHAVNIMKRRAK